MPVKNVVQFFNQKRKHIISSFESQTAAQAGLLKELTMKLVLVALLIASSTADNHNNCGPVNCKLYRFADLLPRPFLYRQRRNVMPVKT